MKVMNIIKYVFAVAGICLLLGALFAYRSTSAFLAESVKAEGTVVDFVPSRSDNSITYRPVVQFTGQSGEEIEFVSSAGSNPPGYSAGQTVEVLYRPDDPQHATINGFFSLWGASVILALLGGPFLLIGSGIFLAGRLKGRKIEFLKKHGTPVQTEFQCVEQNTTMSVNGRHPFRVLTQWRNPSTSRVHIFVSDNIWLDPSEFMGNRKIRVFIAKENPAKYYVDLEFLPDLAT